METPTSESLPDWKSQSIASALWIKTYDGAVALWRGTFGLASTLLFITLFTLYGFTAVFLYFVTIGRINLVQGLKRKDSQVVARILFLSITITLGLTFLLLSPLLLTILLLRTAGWALTQGKMEILPKRWKTPLQKLKKAWKGETD